MQNTQQKRRDPQQRMTSKDEQYEAMKAAWCRAHPQASPVEYQRVMREIAKMVGV